MGQGELQVLDEELLDVWAADILGLLNLDDLENLGNLLETAPLKENIVIHTWTDLKRDR